MSPGKKGHRLESDKTLEELQTIECSLQLEELRLSGMRWSVKLTVEQTLPRAYHVYKILLSHDAGPLTRQIEMVQKDLDAGLFKEEKTAKSNALKRVTELEKQLATERQLCEEISFAATVEEIKYRDGGTKLKLRIPDDVIEAFNRQKVRLDLYKISLVPVNI